MEVDMRLMLSLEAYIFRFHVLAYMLPRCDLPQASLQFCGNAFIPRRRATEAV